MFAVCRTSASQRSYHSEDKLYECGFCEKKYVNNYYCPMTSHTGRIPISSKSTQISQSFYQCRIVLF